MQTDIDMNKIPTNYLRNLLIGLIVITSCVTACQEDDDIAISNDLRVLKALKDDSDISNGDIVDNENLSIQLIFSHSLNTSAFEGALNSNATGYTISYDETNSFVTLSFPTLDFDTEYSITLPAGVYGAGGEELTDTYSLQFMTSEFVPSEVTLKTDKTALLEGDSALITATLNTSTIDDVTIQLTTSGSAEAGTDYTLSEESILIPRGETTASLKVRVLNDTQIEGEELAILEISEVINAVEKGEQRITLTINDEEPALVLKGILALRWATETDGNSGKAVHLKAAEDIADLSIYSLGVANNGGGTDGPEFQLPAISVSAGEDILVSREPSAIESYFEGACYAEFEHVFQTDEMNQNGDDAIELFKGTSVIETYGDANVDGTDQSWEYTGSWAYKLGADWVNGQLNCTDGSTTTLTSACTYPLCDSPLVLKGVLALLWDGSGTNGGKAVHLLANKDIEDLSQYGIGVANNGGGTDGIEYNFPAISVSEGDHILLAREVTTLSGYFGSCANGYDHIFETDAMNQNGDDAIELFFGADVIETYGDANVDGTGEFWEYSGSWAYKQGGDWTYGGVDCAAASTSNQNSACPYLFCE